MNPLALKIFIQSMALDWLAMGGGNRPWPIRRPDDVSHQPIFEAEIV